MIAEQQRPEIVAAELQEVSAWFVGGVVRDALLGRPLSDLDLVADGEVERLAKGLGRALSGAAFPLSEEFGGWRVVPHHGGWQVDITPLADGGIGPDLARRDLTINAIACPAEAVLAGGAAALTAEAGLIDPHGGIGDLRSATLRHVGPDSFADDPLRVARLARIACNFGFHADPATIQLARASAAGLSGVAGERAMAELLALLASADPVGGVRLLKQCGGLSALIPELDEVDGLGQSVYHHLDVWEHTLEALSHAVELQSDPARLGPSSADADSLLSQQLADGVSRWTALRLAVLLHDVAKGRTRTEFPNGKIGFPGHDRLGAQMSEAILSRLRSSSKLKERISTIVDHHLDLGFMCDRLPVSRRAELTYLRAASSASLDLTVLTVADRLATRGKNSEAAIAKHLDVAGAMITAAVELELNGLPQPLLRGDQLAEQLEIAPGPQLGELLSEIEAARYAGEISTPAEALEHARRVLAAAG